MRAGFFVGAALAAMLWVSIGQSIAAKAAPTEINSERWLCL
jgi:hypothetical protein